MYIGRQADRDGDRVRKKEKENPILLACVRVCQCACVRASPPLWISSRVLCVSLVDRRLLHLYAVRVLLYYLLSLAVTASFLLFSIVVIRCASRHVARDPPFSFSLFSLFLLLKVFGGDVDLRLFLFT